MPEATKNRKKKKEWMRIYYKTGVWNNFKHRKYFSHLKTTQSSSFANLHFQKFAYVVSNYAEISTD